MAKRDQQTAEMPGLSVLDEPRADEPAELKSVLVPEELLRAAEQVAAPAPRTKYFLTVTAESPFQNIGVAGLTFHRETEIVDVSGTGRTTRSPQRGCVVKLSQPQVEKATDAIARRVVRLAGPKVARELNTDTAYYQRNPRTDIPLGCFLVLLPLTDGMPADWRGRDIPPMVPVPERFAKRLEERRKLVSAAAGQKARAPGHDDEDADG